MLSKIYGIKNTRRIDLLRILTKAKYPAQIVTKSDIIADPEYIEAMKKNVDNLLLQISITSASDNISNRLESGAPCTSRRLSALSKLVKEGFFTTVRVNPLFPIYPDGTLVRITDKSNLRGLPLFQSAGEKNIQTLPIFNLNLINNIISVFEQSPNQTKGKHTIIAGFVRLPFACVNGLAKQ